MNRRQVNPNIQNTRFFLLFGEKGVLHDFEKEIYQWLPDKGISSASTWAIFVRHLVKCSLIVFAHSRPRPFPFS